MNTEAHRHPIRSVAATLIATLCLCGAGRAALPLDAIRSMQKDAPEKVTIEIVDAEKEEKKRGGGFLFEMTVKAKVTAVESSASGLEKGDELKIRYSFPNFEKSPAAGDWPGEVSKGKTYKAYLRVKSKNKGTAEPAAHSGSFE